MKSIMALMALVTVAAISLMSFQSGHAAAQDKILERVAVVENSAEPFWKSKARAERGDPTAQYEMGRRYEMGDGVPRELEKARRWYLKAAGQGNIWAQNNLGRFYGSGEGVTHNYVTAHMWFIIASDGGSLIAKSNGKYTRARMTTFEVKKARNRAQDWLADHPFTKQNLTGATPHDG